MIYVSQLNREVKIGKKTDKCIRWEINKELQYFPVIRLRYVNEVFAIFDTKRLICTILCHCSIKDFSLLNLILKQGIRNNLPFLDILVLKK